MQGRARICTDMFSRLLLFRLHFIHKAILETILVQTCNVLLCFFDQLKFRLFFFLSLIALDKNLYSFFMNIDLLLALIFPPNIIIETVGNIRQLFR